jgi:hypothetical protein
VSRNAHHAQLLATPPSRTRFVTRFGVSVLNVVATIDTPMSHQGAARPDVKNSVVLDPARRMSHSAGANEIESERMTMVQSRVVSCMCLSLGAEAAARRRPTCDVRRTTATFNGNVCNVLGATGIRSSAQSRKMPRRDHRTIRAHPRISAIRGANDIAYPNPPSEGGEINPVAG